MNQVESTRRLSTSALWNAVTKDNTGRRYVSQSSSNVRCINITCWHYGILLREAAERMWESFAVFYKYDNKVVLCAARKSPLHAQFQQKSPWLWIMYEQNCIGLGDRLGKIRAGGGRPQSQLFGCFIVCTVFITYQRNANLCANFFVLSIDIWIRTNSRNSYRWYIKKLHRGSMATWAAAEMGWTLLK